MNINLVYFSATHTTKNVVSMITGHLEGADDKINKFDITQVVFNEDVICDADSLLVVGVPVYAGRIPAKVAKMLNKFKGNDTPAVIICVYGNRDYDDALLELKDIVEANGFRIISAGAFIAQHSIFPKVGEGRPDERDNETIKSFAAKTAERYSVFTAKFPQTAKIQDIAIKGNRPYKAPGNVPLKPKGNKNCNSCFTCVKRCPVNAIDEQSPRKTNKKICISCGRCIVDCPQKARSFEGLLYKFAGKLFVKANSVRKEPEVFFV